MFVAYTVAAVIYGLMNVSSAIAKIRGVDRVAGVLTTVGVPPRLFTPLALLNIAGGIGLWIGIAWRPLGIAAAAGLALYFAGAVIAHIRVRDTAGIPLPAILSTLAVITLALAIASA
ncbi:DoxX family protein [Catenuloplanes japonicus]|uniref:DoxX family protein n=1 Tax=Catenuloplanes japonicus TaxID=33876 RepID=UPI0005266649|nr:DoxX family protein [Catenuloplanes japonicus]